MNIAPLKINRLNLIYQPLTIKNAVKQAELVGTEESNNYFLKAVITDNQGEQGLEFGEWTVQERTLAICHYLSYASLYDEKDPDFEVGNGKYSDFVSTEAELDMSIPPMQFKLADDSWRVVHLLGKFAESIERLEGSFEISNALHWDVGVIASQLRNQDDTDELDLPTGLDDWLHERMTILLEYPESDFVALAQQVEIAQNDSLYHYFRMSNDAEGLTVLPTEGGLDLSPVRFSSLSAISQRIKYLYRPTDKPSD